MARLNAQTHLPFNAHLPGGQTHLIASHHARVDGPAQRSDALAVQRAFARRTDALVAHAGGAAGAVAAERPAAASTGVGVTRLRLRRLYARTARRAKSRLAHARAGHAGDVAAEA